MPNFDCTEHTHSSSIPLTHFLLSLQVCDSDTMLDPASSVEMVKVLEEDPMVGGVGGDVQVHMASRFSRVTFSSTLVH